MNNGDMPAMPLKSGNIEWNHETGWRRIGDSGLTKREHFAAIAMQGLLAAGSYDKATEKHTSGVAVRHADALLKALEAKA